jgi:Arc/MetJ family transcription regulator
MRTNIVLDDDLVAEAFTCAESIHTKRELIETALREFIRIKKMKDLRDLQGTIRFAEGYDHKKMRAER